MTATRRCSHTVIVTWSSACRGDLSIKAVRRHGTFYIGSGLLPWRPTPHWASCRAEPACEPRPRRRRRATECCASSAGDGHPGPATPRAHRPGAAPSAWLVVFNVFVLGPVVQAQVLGRQPDDTSPGAHTRDDGDFGGHAIVLGGPPGCGERAQILFGACWSAAITLAASGDAGKFPPG